uniref:Bicarbonate transporter-like transmembrane domain-containing protein n=1 Tax=Calcidiscus leptoporus TaxID=127549 RepID=A0A7S0NMB4_9EUKA|mmetsp:Transcript_10796/g.25042  ORF Transcript_10796/g.25042 Transcript_10796/m.25042 type:complete len:580 (+) Transcript_10796:98-1837(+)
MCRTANDTVEAGVKSKEEAHGSEAAAPSADERFKVTWNRRLFAEMKRDLARRRPFYISDWKDAYTRKAISSALFMFFTSIAPAVTFSSVLDSKTRVDDRPQLGPVEVILSTAITGTIFAIFGGQPLVIVGVTGPVTIFTIAVFNVADALDVDFVPFYCWVQIWSALMHMVLAVVNACDLITLVTRYSCETFGMLIAIIYIYNGLYNLIDYFVVKTSEVALLSLITGLGTAYLALLLTSARGWSIFTRTPRSLIADYGATVAIVFFCFVPYMGSNYDLTPAAQGDEISRTSIETLEVPDTVQPSADRGWLVNPADCPVWAIFLAIVPAFILTVLFFFDHNVSSLLCQAPEFGLKKGSAYHWDFFIVGVQILVTGLLGIPPVNGLIPQAPLHTDSLCDKEWRVRPGGSGCHDKVEVIVRCHEQRVSGLAQAVLIGLTLCALTVIGYVPIAALDGLFLYMGVASFAGNSFYQRIMLFITDATRRDARGLDFLDKVPMPVIRKYTALQLVILVCIFGVTLVPYADCLFPVFIAVLVPLRIYTLPKMFGRSYVDLLDAEGQAPVLSDTEELAPAASSAKDVSSA